MSEVMTPELDPRRLSDDELTALALAADPDAPVPEDAVPLSQLDADPDAPLLPDWYMPSPMAGARRLSRARRRVVYVVITAFVLINAAGLCSTYGHIVIA